MKIALRLSGVIEFDHPVSVWAKFTDTDGVHLVLVSGTHNCLTTITTEGMPPDAAEHFQKRIEQLSAEQAA